MRRKASRNNKNAMHPIENTKTKRHTLMVGWEKPVTIYNKNNNKKNNNKNLDCHMHKECRYAGDRDWLNARGKKSLMSARWHLCSLSLASLLLRSLHSPSVQCYCTTTNISTITTEQRSLPLSVLAVQRSLPSVSDRHIYIYIYIYIH